MEGAFIATANSYQTAVLDFVRRGAGHGIVEATAGSGKTTTLVMVAQLLVSELLEPHARACFLAFNRSTAAELRTRLPPEVEAQTIHSLGRQILADARRGEPQLEPEKYRRIALQLLVGNGADATAASDTQELAAHLAELFGFARLKLSDLSDSGALHALRRRYGLAAPRPPAGLSTLYELLPAMHEAGRVAASVDFTDMLYLPWRLSLPAPRLAFLCVDEAQDLSPLALGLVLRLIDGGARALFVGDPYQAIYEFAGADARSLRRIERLTAATLLPLSVSFRCPTSHVVLARRFSPEMKPAAAADRGVVSVLSASGLAQAASSGDLIMARTNAPLPALALDLAAAGKPVRILGHDLVTPAKELAAALFSPATAPEESAEHEAVSETLLGHDSEARLERSAESERLRLENELLTSEQLPGELERSRLTHATLRLALRVRAGGQSGRTVGELTAVLERLFDPTTEHVLLATCHKAKGREAARAFLLYPELLGVTESLDDAGASAADDSALAEANVLFVALTRAKRELVLVEAEAGAIAARLEAAGDELAAAERAAAERAANADHEQAYDLGRRWNDVLRLALIMSKAAGKTGISSRHGKTRRVQERRRQTGGRGRRVDRRRDRQGGDNR